MLTSSMISLRTSTRTPISTVPGMMLNIMLLHRWLLQPVCTYLRPVATMTMFSRKSPAGSFSCRNALVCHFRAHADLILHDPQIADSGCLKQDLHAVLQQILLNADNKSPGLSRFPDGGSDSPPASGPHWMARLRMALTSCPHCPTPSTLVVCAEIQINTDRCNGSSPGSVLGADETAAARRPPHSSEKAFRQKMHLRRKIRW